MRPTAASPFVWLHKIADLEEIDSNRASSGAVPIGCCRQSFCGLQPGKGFRSFAAVEEAQPPAAAPFKGTSKNDTPLLLQRSDARC
ncbi:MAG: hypothetical protein ACRECP_09895 [Methylocella sp.]